MRFLFKLLGFMQIEVDNVPPKDLIKILWAVTGIIVLMIFFTIGLKYVTQGLG